LYTRDSCQRQCSAVCVGRTHQTSFSRRRTSLKSFKFPSKATPPRKRIRTYSRLDSHTIATLPPVSLRSL
jgi:hypothetical protein